MTDGTLNVGNEAPDFLLRDQDARDVRLSDHRGRWVVLYFYPRDNTTGCTREAVDFTARIDRFRSLGAEVLGVSPDSIGSHERFIERHGLKVRLLSDTQREVLSRYGAWGRKRMYGRESEGVIRTTYLVDPEGRVAAVWSGVRVKGHADEVLRRLEELAGSRTAGD
ncbi:MAG TPA: peroxiredoxin [Thermoplasmata archaeon]|nr:peroxiredoxin [Thermoplasmata archaeon]